MLKEQKALEVSIHEKINYTLNLLCELGSEYIDTDYLNTGDTEIKSFEIDEDDDIAVEMYWHDHYDDYD